MKNGHPTVLQIKWWLSKYEKIMYLFQWCHRGASRFSVLPCKFYRIPDTIVLVKPSTTLPPGAILRYCINGLSSHVLLVGTEINSIHPSLYAGQCTYPASQIHIFTKLFFHSLSQWSCLLFGRLAKILGKIRIYQVSIILLLSSSWLAFSSTDDEVHIYIRI